MADRRYTKTHEWVTVVPLSYQKTIFFTGRTSIYSMRAKVPGLPGHPFRR